MVAIATTLVPGIYEKTDRLGGTFIPASAESYKGKLRDLLKWYIRQMDELGISPTSVAENVLGIRTKYKSGEKAPENTLIRDAQNAVQKRTEGFFTVLWDGFLDTIESIITNGISIFSGLEGSGDKGGVPG